MSGALVTKAAAKKRDQTGARGTAFRQLFNTYRHNAGIHSRSWELSDDHFADLTSRDCAYCGSPPDATIRRSNTTWTYNGLDRVDNSHGYDLDNVVACCATCNYMKRSMTAVAFRAHIDRIHAHTHRPQSS